MLKNILETSRSIVQFGLAYVNIYSKGIAARYRNARSVPKILFRRDYSNEAVLLLALYQQGQMRNDIITLLKEAKRAGYYVIAVNSQNLEQNKILNELIDLYIERGNFGRDFGSYKVGFEEIYSSKIDVGCNRLVMLNDSVFYSSKGLRSFLQELKDSGRDVIGATENFEIEHHIGSFCISISGAILRHQNLRNYWINYRNSDIRPRVIRFGEMALSRTLKSCVKQSKGFGALYSASWYQNYLDGDAQMTNVVMRLCRNSPLVDWPRSTPKGMLEYVTARFLVQQYNSENTMVQIDADISQFSSYSSISDYDELLRILNSRLVPESSLSKDQARKLVNSFFLEMFIRGSQIHQNAAILFHSGLPIVKLDGFYRGMFDGYDLQLIADQLPDEEKEDFVYLMTQRSFGGHALTGWRLIAFNRGLI